MQSTPTECLARVPDDDCCVDFRGILHSQRRQVVDDRDAVGRLGRHARLGFEPVARLTSFVRP